MGRIGITQLEVENAILKLQGLGKSPTVDGIREILGTGSKTTILQCLTQWKSKKSNHPTNLPAPFVALMGGLWEQLQNEAQMQVKQLEDEYDSKITTLQDFIEKQGQDFSRLTNEFNDLSQINHLNENKINELQIQNTHQETQNHLLKEKIEGVLAQLSQTKDENTQLHQLAKHIQKNLEHYQQSMQQLQLSQKIEMQKQEQQSQLQLEDLKNQINILNNALNVKEYALKVLGDNYDVLNSAHEKITEQFKITDKLCALYQDRLEQCEKQNSMKEMALKENQALVSEQTVKINVFSEQIQQLNILLKQSDDKLNTLLHENVFISHENEQLKKAIKLLQMVETEKTV